MGHLAKLSKVEPIEIKPSGKLPEIDWAPKKPARGRPRKQPEIKVKWPTRKELEIIEHKKNQDHLFGENYCDKLPPDTTKVVNLQDEPNRERKNSKGFSEEIPQSLETNTSADNPFNRASSRKLSGNRKTKNPKRTVTHDEDQNHPHNPDPEGGPEAT